MAFLKLYSCKKTLFQAEINSFQTAVLFGIRIMPDSCLYAMGVNLLSAPYLKYLLNFPGNAWRHRGEIRGSKILHLG